MWGRPRPDQLARIEADITAFGEELAQHELLSSGHSEDELLLADFRRALDAYEEAKSVADNGGRDSVEDVLRALDEGRHALACVDARSAGRPVPSRHPCCFFDPRHGASTTEIAWSPPEGAARTIAVCAADAVRITDGLAPLSTGRRTVQAAVGGQVRGEGGRPAPARRPSPPSRRSPPSPPSPPSPSSPSAASALRGVWRPYKTWPPGTPRGQCAEVRDISMRTEIRLLRPDSAGPALLAIRAVHGSVGTVDVLGGPSQRRILKKSKAPRLVVPLPADGEDHVHLALEPYGHLQLWTQSLDLVPVLGTGLSSVGGFVFRHIGGPVTIQVGKRGGGRAFRIHALSTELTTGDEVLAAEGEAVMTGGLPGPGLYLVGATAAQWRITLVP